MACNKKTLSGKNYGILQPFLAMGHACACYTVFEIGPLLFLQAFPFYVQSFTCALNSHKAPPLFITMVIMLDFLCGMICTLAYSAAYATDTHNFFIR